MKWGPRRLKGWLWQCLNISWVCHTRANQNMLLWIFSLWDALWEMVVWANNFRNIAHYNYLTPCRFTGFINLFKNKNSFSRETYLTLYNSVFQTYFTLKLIDVPQKKGYARERLIAWGWRWSNYSDTNSWHCFQQSSDAHI